MASNGATNGNGTKMKPIAIYHEHPDWFRPLFTELDKRGTNYERLDARTHAYDAGGSNGKYALVFNRMSPSAYLRGNGDTIFYTLNFLKHLEDSGTRVVNGHRAFTYETSKALQLSLLESLALPFPRARIIHRAAQAPAASVGLRFPVVVKPNIGGSGAGVTKFENVEAIERAVANNEIDLGIDSTGLVQEFLPAQGRIHHSRRSRSAANISTPIRVYLTGESYNLCPADICQTTDGKELVRNACPVNAEKTGLKVEGFAAPPDVIADVELIMKTAGIEVGGVEYIIDERDGQRYYYDVNALSNFVADATRVVGLDPHAALVDFLEKEAR